MLLGGELLRTELDAPQRILDVGTGTGLWAIDCADQYPTATVVATDLSPIQPTLVPENLQFFIDDAESDWDWEPFDLIHARCLSGSIQDWPRFYQQCFDHMMPGGRLEIQEHDSLIKSADTKVPPWTSVWMNTLTKAFDDRGQSINAADKHARWMEEAGFVDIEDRVHQVPIGSWAKDKSLKELGRWHQVQMVDAVEPYTLAIFTDVLGRDVEETQVAIEMVRKEFREKKHHLYVRYHFVTGRKPD